MKKSKLFLMLLFSMLLITAACGTSNTSNASSPDDSSSETQTEESATEQQGTEDEDVKETETPVEDDSSETTTEEAAVNEAAAEEEAVTEATATVWLYFADDMVMDVYRTEETITAASEEALPKAALEKWLAGPSIEGLASLVPENIEVQSVEQTEEGAIVSFSPELLDANLGSGSEAFLIEQITMIMEQFGSSQTKILVDGQEADLLFGHVDATQSFEAGSPEDYEIKTAK